MTLLLLFLGGALGALTRFWTTRLTLHLIPNPPIPLGTLLVNLVGSALLGTLFGTHQITLTTTSQAPFFLFASVGFCAALTTFSSFATETALLLRTSLTLSALYIALTIGGSLLTFRTAYLLMA